MRERTRLESEIEYLREAAPARERETPPDPDTAWPPMHLKQRFVFRHWRRPATGSAGRPVVLQAKALDPRFIPMPAAKSCLKDWTSSTIPSATHSLVAVVDLSQNQARYLGVKDTVAVNLVSTAKLAIMYPAFQLRRDVREIAERDRPANAAALFEAVRAQWTTDLVDAGPVGKDRGNARRRVNANGPKLDEIVAFDPATTISANSHPVSFTSTFGDALTRMIVNSNNAGRQRCIDSMQETYITSVLAQSGKLAQLKPLTWGGTMEALACLLTLVARGRLSSYQDSIEMWRLMERGAKTGAGTWTRYALDGMDDESDATKKRNRKSVSGKIGYLHGGPKATWWDNITTMADASLVVKNSAGKIYALCFAIPFHQRVIRQKDVFPLIRAVHDCI